MVTKSRRGATSRVTDDELGRGLIEKVSFENFEPENYDDEYRERVLALLDEKAKGRQITVAPKRPRLATSLI